MHPKHQAAIDAFGDFWIARVKRIAEETKPTGLQFHYTRSILAVENIIRTNTIWFGDIRQMNDEVELRYALELYQDEALQLAETRASVSERVLRYMSEPSKRDGVFEEFRFFFIGRPELQDNFKRFAHQEAVDSVRTIDVEHLPIARQAARCDPKAEPSARDMVENCDAVGDLHRMMEGQQEPAGSEPDVLRLHEGLGHQEIGRGVRLPGAV